MDRVSTGKALRAAERVLWQQIRLLQDRSAAGALPDDDIARLGALVDIYAKLLAIPRYSQKPGTFATTRSASIPNHTDEELLAHAEEIDEDAGPGEALD